ncbi:MAG: glycosyltransferase [Acidobacteriaceae bacterium]|nr:glycosyltransferase [Acidobacteriaceae bacterium]MBV9780226.1 glycosyltransferase [Acidobacteriaceae bacterium]
MPKSSGDVLVSEPPGERLEVCVSVPAKDEEELLPSALRALAEQKTDSGEPIAHERYEVILLINNTRDRSRQVAEQFKRLYPTFQLHIVERNFKKSHSHNGYVRRLLMDEACRRLESRDLHDSPILSTDSDSQVAPNWISRNREELTSGAEAVGGRIVIPACEECLLDPATRAIQRYDHLYRRLVAWVEDSLDPQAHDPWPRHHQHFGASFAVTPRVYKRIGRMPPRRYLEDIALYQALMRHDVRLRHSNKVRVFTSARLAGRARFGLSSELTYWQSRGKKVMRVPVERREFLEYLFIARRRLRLLWLDYRDTAAISERRVRDIARITGIHFAHLMAELQSAPRFGVLLERIAFYEACRKMWPDQLRLAPMKNVVDELLAAFRRSTRLAAPKHQFDTDRYELVSSIPILAASAAVRVHHLPGAGSPAQLLTSEPATNGRPTQYASSSSRLTLQDLRVTSNNQLPTEP